jgi:hypothetical protein
MAARREEVTAEQVRRLVKYLQEARSDPTMRFEGNASSVR